MRRKAAISILFLLALLPTAALAAASVSPGSTSTIMSMPVTQNFKGLTASTSYTLYLKTGSNSSVAVFNSDSSGEASVTITDFDDYGQNTYELRLTAGGSVVVSFNIDNMDIIPYVLPIIVISVLFGLFGLISRQLR